VLRPSGRPDHDVRLPFREPAHVARHGAGNREVDRDVGVGPRRRRVTERRVDAADDLHAVAGAELVDDAAHPAVAEQ